MNQHVTLVQNERQRTMHVCQLKFGMFCHFVATTPGGHDDIFVSFAVANESDCCDHCIRSGMWSWS